MASTGMKIIRGLTTALLVFMFFSAGLMKLTNKFSAKAFRKMTSDFARFAKVHPAVRFGYHIDSDKYMRQVGIIELAGATFLLLGPRPLKLLSCLLLSSVMIGAMYTLHQLNEPIQLLMPAALALLLLFIKLHFLLIGTERKSSDSDVKKQN